MPEGPSIVILKEEAAIFKSEKVKQVSGNSKIDLSRLQNQRVLDFKSWGKHFLICFKGFTVRIHLMLFGSYRINEKREMQPRLSLLFKNGELNFYNCSVKILEEDLNTLYDWEVDIMSDKWNAKKVLGLLKSEPLMVCDALLDQHIFAGSGNIIKNEVLFRIKVHPESMTSALPSKKFKRLVDETRDYAFKFYEWKKIFELKKHWLVYRTKTCPDCKGPISHKILGVSKRSTFFCAHCQLLFA